MISYLKFLLKSTNQHGVHSPFVFDYLTKCLYKKPRLSKKKLEDVILKSIAYFDCSTAFIEDENLKNKLPQLKHGRYPLDIVILKTFKLDDLIKVNNEEQIHNNTLIIVQNPRQQLNEWQKVIAHPKITVSMNCFSLGMLFVRKEQVKEHFTIRL